MSALSLTRAQIIEAGLGLAGRPDLVSEARLWLNLFLEQQYMNQDFLWLVKTGELEAFTDGMDFPDDYRAGKTATLVDSSSGRVMVQIIDRADQFDGLHDGYRYDLEHETTGQPAMIYANHDERKFYCHPKPRSTYSIQLKYYYIPSLPDHTDTFADEDSIKWGLPAQILIDHIKMRAFEYNDDQRYSSTKQEVQGDVAAAKVNNHDRRAGTSRLAMGKRFKKRF